MLEKNSQTFIGLSLVSRFLYRSLHQAPTQEFLNSIYDDKIVNDWPVEVTNSTLSDGISLITSKAQLTDINADFANLFVGPNTLGAAPWASVYLNEEQTTFGIQTLDIRFFYAQFGVEVDTGEREPDDHIGLIFSFIAHLCECIAEQLESDETLEVIPLTTFLSEHVLTWAPRMLQLMSKNAETEFYQGIALIAEGTLRQLAQLAQAKYLIVPLYR
ncbi:molecular chaperone TorD family protein [Photobacterium sp. ZSDE20]|uniref:Molecular chaperone TorD family protein n=1 Tax=Photobacterium pectinilyticum TaxID=2906793 RepID=A0ABT1N3M2_9GAMM|nr:molecular chaperone TorD family protein [Photobacterium sp. ZSDE20]MCQ1059332.1 molecular chaperone TorD family protein [Photobacterium sp. ZSDE20]MDD1825591.1 molecular chaperone TorD family protein [Photobacterium sp. ZSDE20]